MAQNYSELRKNNVRDAIYEDVQNNFEVLRTSWSGNDFPENPKVGQPCYRVDEDKLYYWDGLKWSQKGGGGSAELKSMELPAIETERVSIILEGARCLDKNMMFVFVDKIAQDPSTYSMNDDGTVVNFNPAIPANAAVTLRWFDTDVGTFDTAIFASDAEFAAGELTNRAPNVKQVHSLSDMVASKLSGLELMDVGFAPLGIDESKNKRRYLNGQLIIQSQFPAFTAAVKARMTTMANAFTTEENWQAEKTNSKLGQCGKFVVDDTAGTIRLPAVVNAQGLVDLALIGGIKSESLPNITGETVVRISTNAPEGAGTTHTNTVSGAFVETGTIGSMNGGSEMTSTYLKGNFNASRSSSTYQDNAPVQQEAVQYPYYIQVATGVEETLPAIREYKINTPFFFGQSMYSDVAPDNASWLVSNGQYNAKSVYPDYYDWLVEKMNAGVSGFVASTSAYTDYDFVINTTDQTFRLPLLNGDRVLVKKYVNGTDWYNLYSDGWLEQGGYISSVPSSTSGVAVAFLKPFSNTNYFSSPSWGAVQYAAFGIKDRTTTGMTVVNRTNEATFCYWQACGYAEIPAQSEFTEVSGLYYYIGDTVQDASLINAGAVLGQLATKTNSVEAAEASMPSSRYIDLTLGASGSTYTAPANGYVYLEMNGTQAQQNGYINSSSSFHGTYYGGYTPISGRFGHSIIYPVTKGEVFTVAYSYTETVLFRFFYAEGDQ